MRSAAHWWTGFFAASVTALLCAAASAQEFPSKPLRLVLAYPPGGSSDILARPIADELRKSLRQPVAIEYKPGAGSSLAADFIAKAPPDGYTIGMLLSPLAINVTAMPNLPYDAAKDFAPITLAARLPLAIVVKSDSFMHTVQDVLWEAKSHPGKMKYGSTGPGGHLAAEAFKLQTGTEIAHVSYPSAPAAVAGVLAGEVRFLFDSLSNSLAQVREGKLRVIAVSTASRSSVLPDVPTIAEAGVPGFEVSAWYGIFAPAGTPPDVVAKLNTEIAKAMRAPANRSAIEAYGYEIVCSTPAEMDALLQSEIPRWAAVVKATQAAKPPQ